MTASKRDIERRIDDLEGSGEDPDPPDYVFLDELKDGTCPPGTPTIADMLSGVAHTELLVDTRDGDEVDASGDGSGDRGRKERLYD